MLHSNTPTREDVIEVARSYIGVKWKHQGRNRFGVDCIGLLVCVGQDLGLSFYDHSGYSRLPISFDFVSHFYKAGAIETPDQLIPANLLVLRDGRYPCHCGILTRNNNTLYFVHSYASARQVCEEPLTQAWRDKIVKVFSWPTLVDSPWPS